MSWYLNSSMFSHGGGEGSLAHEQGQLYSDVEVIYGLPKAHRLQQLKKSRKGRVKTATSIGKEARDHSPTSLLRPSSVPLGDELPLRWQGVTNNAVQAYSALRHGTPPPISVFSDSLRRPHTSAGRESLWVSRPSSRTQLRSATRPNTSDGVQTPEKWTRTRGLMAAHDVLMVKRTMHRKDSFARGLESGIAGSSPLIPLAPTANQAKWFAAAVSKSNLAAMLRNLRTAIDADLEDIKPHNRALLASLFQLRASDSEMPPDSPRLTGRLPKELLLGLLTGLRLLEPVEHGHEDTLLRWTTRQVTDAEHCKGGADGPDDLGSLTLSWVLNWLRRRRMQTQRDAQEREWRVSGQSADALSWADFKSFFRAVARKLLGVPQEDDGKAVRRSRSESTAPVGVPGPGADNLAERIELLDSKTASLFEQHLDEAAAGVMTEVEGLFRQFEPTGNYSSCGLDALRSSLYMNGYTHRAVTSMIEEAAKVVEEERRELSNQTATSQSSAPAAAPPSEPRVSAIAFGRILASFLANKRAETNDTRKFNNCVRLLVVRAGVVTDLLPSLLALQTAVFPRFMDAAIELGGTVEVEHVTLDDYTDWLSSPAPAQAAEHCRAPAMGLKEFHAHLAGCRMQVGHVISLFLCDATLGQRRLPRFIKEGELSTLLQQLRKRKEAPPSQNHGFRTMAFKSSFAQSPTEDSRYAGLANVLEACYSSQRVDLERSPQYEDNSTREPGWATLTGDLALLRSAHEEIGKLMDAEAEDSEVLQALSPAWQPTTALQVVSEMLTNAMDSTFIAVRDGRDDRLQPAAGSKELMEILEKVPRDHVTWYPVIPEESLARKQSQAVNLVDKVRLARTKLVGAIAFGLRAKHWSLSEQHSEMQAITERRWLSHVQVDCYNQLSTPIFQSLVKDTTYHEQRGHERELVRVFENIDKHSPKLPQHKSQKSATRAIARYLEHSVNSKNRNDDTELATLRHKAEAQPMEQHVHDSLHSYHEALRLGAAEWSLLDDELQFPIFTDKSAAHQAMLELPMQAKQRAAQTFGDKWVGMTFPERIVVVITIMEVERLTSGEEDSAHEAERHFGREPSGGAGGAAHGADEHHTLHKHHPVLVVGHRGVGRTTAIALAMKQAECMEHVLVEQRDEASKDETLGRFDGRVDSTIVLRVVGATAFSTNGNDLLRSIIIQIREEYDPQNHLQMAVPATQEDLEKGLLTAMGMATLHRPLIVVVDGIDRLHPRDPARRMLWVPKTLPFHCRLLVVATPELRPSEALTMFRGDNVLDMHPPPLVAVHALAEEIAATTGKSRRALTNDEISELENTFISTCSLSLLKLASTFAVQSGWLLQAEQGGNILFTLHDERLHVSGGAFDDASMACLSMLAMSRGGLTLAHMEHAWKLFEQSAVQFASDRATEQEKLERGAVKRETFDASLRSVSMLTARRAHGKCMVLVCDDPWIASAVRSSEFYQTHKQELCKCLITTASDASARFMPIYMQTAVLPSLQIQAARFSGALNEDLPHGVDGTVEAGLLEDLLVDLQECLTAAALGEFVISETCESCIRRHRDILTCNKALLLKPFHALLVDQMKTRTGGRGCARLSTQWSKEIPSLEHWQFTEVTNEHIPAVYCTASHLHPCAATSCAVGAGRSSTVYAVGLEDGTVAVWDGVSGDRIGQWKAHDSRVVICHILQRQVNNVDEWVPNADGGAAGIGVMSGTERGLDESCWWMLMTSGWDGDVRLWSIPDFQEVLKHALDCNGSTAPGNRAAMLSGTLHAGAETKTTKGHWTSCDSRPMGPDGMAVCFGSTCGQLYAAALIHERNEMIAMDTAAAHETAITCVSMAREWPGCLIASCSRDASVRIWEFGISGKLMGLHRMVVEGSHLFWCRFQGSSLYCSGQGVVREWTISNVEVTCDAASVLSTVDMNHFLAQQQHSAQEHHGQSRLQTGVSSPSRRRSSELFFPSKREGMSPPPRLNAARRQSIADTTDQDLKFLSVQDSSRPGKSAFSGRSFESTAAVPTQSGRRSSGTAPIAASFLSVGPPSPLSPSISSDWNVRSMELGGPLTRRSVGSPTPLVQISPVGTADPAPDLLSSPGQGLTSLAEVRSSPSTGSGPAHESQTHFSRASSDDFVSRTPSPPMSAAPRQLESVVVPFVRGGREDLLSEDMPPPNVASSAPTRGSLTVTEGHQLQLKNGQAMKMRHCGMLAPNGVLVACHGMQVVFWDVKNQKKEVLKMRNKATCSAMSLDGSIVLLGFTDNRLRAWQPRAQLLSDELQAAPSDLASHGGLGPSPGSESPPPLLSGVKEAADTSNLTPKFRSALRPPPDSKEAAAASWAPARSKSPPPSGLSRLRSAVRSSAGKAGNSLSKLSRSPNSNFDSGDRLRLVASVAKIKGSLRRAQQRRHEWEQLHGAFRSYGAQNNPLIDTILRKAKKGADSSDEEVDESAPDWGGDDLNEEEEAEEWQQTEQPGLFRTPDLHETEVQHLSISHDGALVMSLAEGTVRVWDTASGRLLETFGRRASYGDVRIAVFSPKLPPSHVMSEIDQDLAMVAWSHHQVVLMRVTSPDEILMEVGSHDLDIRTAKFAPDGSFVVTGSWDNSTCVWQIIRREKPGAGRHSPPPSSPTRRVPMPRSTSGGLSPVASARKEPSPGPSLARAGAGASKGAARPSGSPSSQPSSPLSSPTAAFMKRKHSRSTMAREARESREQRNETAESYSRLLQHVHKSSVLSVGVCPHSKYVASTSADHTIVLFSIVCGQDPPAIERWTGHHGSFVQACDFSSSGKLLASVGGDRICRVWDTESGRIVHVLKTSGALTSVRFSGDAEMVAAGGLRGALQVWSVASGARVAGRPHPVMCDQGCTVTSLAWTPDCRVVIVSGTDGTVWGWDCHKGVLAGCFQRMAVTSYAAVDEHDQGLSHERFELPGVWCAAYHFTLPGSAMRHQRPKPKDPHLFQSSPLARRPSHEPRSPLPVTRSRSPEPSGHANSDPGGVQPSSPGRTVAKAEEAISEEHKSALVVLGTRTGFLHILRVVDWRQGQLGDLKRIARMGRHMHSVYHHQSHHPHATVDANGDDLVHDIRLYSHSRHMAKSLHHEQDGDVGGGLDHEIKSVRGRKGGNGKVEMRRRSMAEQDCRRAESEMLEQLEARAMTEQVMYGWLGKLNYRGDPAKEEDWKTRLCYAVEDEFRYLSEKEGGKAIKICDFHSVSGFEMVDFTCPGRSHGFTLNFAEEEESITFAAATDDERCWWMEAVVEALARKAPDRQADVSSMAANVGTLASAGSGRSRAYAAP